MAHTKTLMTVGALALIAITGMLSGNEPIAYIATGALAGYLGQVNCAKRPQSAGSRQKRRRSGSSESYSSTGHTWRESRPASRASASSFSGSTTTLKPSTALGCPRRGSADVVQAVPEERPVDLALDPRAPGLPDQAGEGGRPPSQEPRSRKSRGEGFAWPLLPSVWQAVPRLSPSSAP